MRIKDKKKRRKFLFPGIWKLLHLDTSKKFLSHSYFYRVAGEDLPERHVKRWVAKLGWTVLSLVVLLVVVAFFSH